MRTSTVVENKRNASEFSLKDQERPTDKNEFYPAHIEVMGLRHGIVGKKEHK